MTNPPLKEYQGKRDFQQTPEPQPRPGAGEGPLIFVIHKHSARSLHYDLRLELDGVLKSWAIPGGLSMDPADKKLAVMVEDHPFDYRSFEGIIPEGQYGGGQVIIWDNGTYSPETEGQFFFDDREKAQALMRDRLSTGKVSFILRGEKLKGNFALIKMRNGKNNWLIIKHHDEFAAPGSHILSEDKSVVSGLRVEDLKSGAPPPPNPAPEAIKLDDIPGVRKAPMPSAMPPMLATAVESPFSDPAWFFEPKLDGYRIISLIRNGEVKLLSRNGHDITKDFPQVIPGLKDQFASEMILDGEMVALEESGRPCFQCLQQHLDVLRQGKDSTEQKIKIVYFVFDILYLDGFDLTGAPISARKEILQRALSGSDRVRNLDFFTGNGESLFQAAINTGFEGVVAKRKDSTYESGQRSKNWLKAKAFLAGEFVVGGYMAGSGARNKTFASLMIGYYETPGKLTYAGNVGTGFDDATLEKLRQTLDAIATEESPFKEVPRLPSPVTFVRPELVAEVKFAQWTHEGYLRAPVFLRLREDKNPAEITRETAAPAPAHTMPVRREVEMVERKIPQQAYQDVLDQIVKAGEDVTLNIEGQKLEVTKLDKVFWPEYEGRRALTKRDMLIYFTKVAPYALPHLKDRPLTLTRFPDGITGGHFYQKHWNSPLPEFVQQVALSENDGEFKQYMLCNNLPTLLWLAQIADIELHTWFSRVDPAPDSLDLSAIKNERIRTDALVNYPDFIVFDIDPYIYSGNEKAGAEPELNRQAFRKAGEFALHVKEIMDSLSLAAFIKTSGKTGLHIFVPIIRKYDYAAVRAFAGTVSKFLAQKYPDEITVEWAVEKRTGKIFMDFNQNARGKNIASIYSPRIAPNAPVSVPLAWDEVTKVYPTDFDLLNVPDRLQKKGDLWAKLLESKRDLSEALKKV